MRRDGEAEVEVEVSAGRPEREIRRNLAFHWSRTRRRFMRAKMSAEVRAGGSAEVVRAEVDAVVVVVVRRTRWEGGAQREKARFLTMLVGVLAGLASWDENWRWWGGHY